MKTTPEFTDAEIQNMMDFKQVLALTEAAHRRGKKHIRRVVTVILISGLVGIGFFAYDRYLSSQPETKSELPASTDPVAAILPDTAQQSKSIRPAIPPDTTKRSINTSDEQDSRKPVRKLEPAAKKEETTPVPRVDSARSVFLPAEPVDGYTALYSYFASELLYPEDAIKDSIQGVILVSFVINTEGKPEQLTTDHALGEAFHQEAIRVIENMPAWKPAQLDGSPVRSKVSVPITFSLKTIKKQ